MQSFRDSWFESWPWLHYHEEMDLAFCHVCVRALKEKKMEPHCCDAAFVSALAISLVLISQVLSYSICFIMLGAWHAGVKRIFQLEGCYIKLSYPSG